MCIVHNRSLLACTLIEVVLVLLLSSFRFSQPAGDKANIFWNRASVTWPSVGPKAAKASLPLILEVITT